MSRTLPCAAVVDVTAAAAAPANVLAAFDALAPGESLLLRTVARPTAALLALGDERAGAFEWVPLMEGPGHWEVEIHRRTAAPGSLRGISEALGWDHDRLDGLDHEADRNWKAGDAREGARLHARFAFGLRRHIRYEENVLFPEFERRSGLPADHGPTAVMRVEHRAIEQLLDDLCEDAACGEPPAEEIRENLRLVLLQHNLKEENVLYPMLDRVLAADEADAAVFRFHALDPVE